MYHQGKLEEEKQQMSMRMGTGLVALGMEETGLESGATLLT